MSATNDGGPAFPRATTLNPTGVPWNDEQQGMSLRDYYAGQALAGELASQSGNCGSYATNVSQGLLVERAAMLWRFADAMIEARKGDVK